MGADRTGTIRLRGLRARGFHGVFDFERAAGQDFVVDLEIDLEMPDADDLAETVDYGSIAGQVNAIIGGEPVNLIETLASRIAGKILDDPRIRRVGVTVHKPHAPIEVPFDDVSVTISRSKHV